MNVVTIKAGGLETIAQQVLPKQFVEVSNKPLIVHTIECFQNSNMINKIIIRITEGYEDILFNYKNKYCLDKISDIVTGGQSGLESILNAYQVLDCKDNDIVIIHEANRPIITQMEIENGIILAKSNNKLSISYKLVSKHIIGRIDKYDNIASSFHEDSFAIYVHPEYVKYKILAEMIKNTSVELIADKSSLEELFEVDQINSNYLNFVESNNNNLKVIYLNDFETIKNCLTIKRDTQMKNKLSIKQLLEVYPRVLFLY